MSKVFYPEYEAAAREYCRLKGLDPDELVMHAPDSSGGIPQNALGYSFRWRLFTPLLREQDLLNMALWGRAPKTEQSEVPRGFPEGSNTNNPGQEGR